MGFAGKGYVDRFLTETEVCDLMAQALEQADLTHKRVLIIIPDSTRTAPLPESQVDGRIDREDARADQQLDVAREPFRVDQGGQVVLDEAAARDARRASWLAFARVPKDRQSFLGQFSG